ncbi:hypothetical protein ACFLW2_03470 [Chloroflexota bacterium]
MPPKIRYPLLFLLVISLLLVVSCNANNTDSKDSLNDDKSGSGSQEEQLTNGPEVSADDNIDRGAWLYDEEGWARGVWYQEVQLTAESKEEGNAYRAIAKYHELIGEIPGLNKMMRTRYPFPGGNWVIEIGFRSQRELDGAMEQNLIPSFLDGVPIIVDDLTGEIELE